jgi:hypothetical protein
MRASQLPFRLVLVLLWLSCTSVYCLASDYSYKNLPNIDTLQKLLNYSDSCILTSELSEFELTKTKFSFWDLFPAISINAVTLRPRVTFSSSFINQKRNQDKIFNSKIISIKQKAAIRSNSNKIKLINLHKNLLSNINQLYIYQNIYNIHKELYTIYSQQHEQNEINTIDFLKDQIAFFSQQKEILRFIDIVNKNFSDIEFLINHSIFEPIIYDDFL